MKIATAALLATAASAHNFKSCPDSPGVLHVTALTLNPDPPQLGKSLSVSFSGKTSVNIAAGKADLAVKLHGIKLTSADFNFCTQLGLKCPLTAGDAFTASLSYNLPSAPLPPGLTITVESTFTDAAGKELDCYTLDTGLGSTDAMLALPGQYPGSLTDDQARGLFSMWRKQFPHVDIDDVEVRYKIFKNNLETVIDHNMNSNEDDYEMGMNEFGHLTWREFKKQYVGTGYRSDLTEFPRSLHQIPSNFTAPKNGVDWAKKGAVTAIKNQGQCGSCWAFSTTGSIEGAYQIKTGTLKSFSEQQLVDCDTKVDQGCNGGLMDNAFAFIKKNKGLCTEASYPYTGVDGTCDKGCKKDPASTVNTFTDVATTAKALMSAVTKQPVSVAIEADQSAFQFYKSGVFTATCGTTLDHGVLAVGFGSMKSDNITTMVADGKKKKSQNYWKVKNSWGASWGLKGFILLQRGKKQAGGQCGILNSASYPTLN